MLQELGSAVATSHHELCSLASVSGLAAVLESGHLTTCAAAAAAAIDATIQRIWPWSSFKIKTPGERLLFWCQERRLRELWLERNLASRGTHSPSMMRAEPLRDSRALLLAAARDYGKKPGEKRHNELLEAISMFIFLKEKRRSHKVCFQDRFPQNESDISKTSTKYKYDLPFPLNGVKRTNCHSLIQ